MRDDCLWEVIELSVQDRCPLMRGDCLWKVIVRMVAVSRLSVSQRGIFFNSVLQGLLLKT